MEVPDTGVWLAAGCASLPPGALSPVMWAVVLICFFVSQVVQNAMFVAQMAFFAKVRVHARERERVSSRLRSGCVRACMLAPRVHGQRGVRRGRRPGIAVLACLVWAAMTGAVAQVSDAAIGGTYMTLLNTVANLGAKWPSTVVLALVDVAAVPGVLDGYHVLNLVCTLAGVLWLLVMHKRVALLVSPAPPPRLSALPHAPALRAQRVVGPCASSHLFFFLLLLPLPPVAGRASHEGVAHLPIPCPRHGPHRRRRRARRRCGSGARCARSSPAGGGA